MDTVDVETLVSELFQLGIKDVEALTQFLAPNVTSDGPLMKALATVEPSPEPIQVSIARGGTSNE
jgi:hypothetical protein